MPQDPWAAFNDLGPVPSGATAVAEPPPVPQQPIPTQPQPLAAAPDPWAAFNDLGPANPPPPEPSSEIIGNFAQELLGATADTLKSIQDQDELDFQQRNNLRPMPEFDRSVKFFDLPQKKRDEITEWSIDRKTAQVRADFKLIDDTRRAELMTAAMQRAKAGVVLPWIRKIEEKVPFARDVAPVFVDQITSAAFNEIEKGKGTPFHYRKVADHVLKLERAAEQGIITGGLDDALVTPAFVTETILTRGGYKALKVAATRGLKRLGIKALGKNVAARAAKWALPRAAGVAGQTALNPQMIAARISERMAPEYELTPDDAGKLRLVLGNDGDGFLEALPKGFLDTFIEIGSEKGGRRLLALVPGSSRLKALKAAMIARFLRKNPATAPGALLDRLARRGQWHGFIEENLEEFAGDIARGSTDFIPGVPNLESGFGIPGQVFTGDFAGAGESLARQGIALAVPGAAKAAITAGPAIAQARAEAAEEREAREQEARLEEGTEAFEAQQEAERAEQEQKVRQAAPVREITPETPEQAAEAKGLAVREIVESNRDRLPEMVDEIVKAGPNSRAKLAKALGVEESVIPSRANRTQFIADVLSEANKPIEAVAAEEASVEREPVFLAPKPARIEAAEKLRDEIAAKKVVRLEKAAAVEAAKLEVPEPSAIPIPRPARLGAAEAVEAPKKKLGKKVVQPEVAEPIAIPIPKPARLEAVEAPKKPLGKKPSTDTLGAVVPASNALDDFVGVIKNVGKKTLAVIGREARTRGDLPQQVFESKVAKEGQVKKEETNMKGVLRDLETATRKEPGWGRRKDLSPEQTNTLDQAFKGNQEAIDSLPEKLRIPVGKMRENIDAMSARAIELGVVAGDMEAAFTKNLGVYAKRSYKIFTDPGWADKVPEEIRKKAKSFIRKEYPELSEDEVNGQIAELLFRGEAAKSSPIAVLAKGGQLGDKNLKLISRRKDIPGPIRALWGEHTDPWVNYAQSVATMAHIISNDQFQKEVVADGEGKFLFEQATVNKDGEFKVEIELAGKTWRTTPEIATAFKKATEPAVVSAGMRWYMKVVGSVKYGKTVLSSMTHSRNLGANTGFALVNGHWRIGEGRKAIVAVLEDMGFQEPASRLAEWAGTKDYFRAIMLGLSKQSKRKTRALLSRLSELGVIHDSANAEELRAVINDASKIDSDQFLVAAEQKRAKSITDFAKRGLKGISALYQAEDDVWKIYGFLNEKARYAKTGEFDNEADLEQHAATILRNTYPTWSMVPSGMQRLRRNPLVGNFVSFASEVYRTTFHSLKQMAIELRHKNPKVRAIGAQRLAGWLLSSTIPAAMSLSTLYLMGFTGDDDDWLREFVPPWSKNSTFWFLPRPNKDQMRVVDLSYSDPHNGLKRPIVALIEGGDWEEKLESAVGEAAAPFLDEEMLTRALVEVWANKKSSGGKIYQESDSDQQKGTLVINHVWDTVEPGILSQSRKVAKGISGEMGRHGQVYNPAVEAGAMITGIRISTVDIPQSMGFQAGDYNRSRVSSTAVLSTVSSRKGSVSDKELREAYQRAVNAQKKTFDDMAEVVHAARGLGQTAEDVRLILRGKGVSAANTEQLIAGVQIPWVPSAQLESAMLLANSAEAASRLKILREMEISTAPDPVEAKRIQTARVAKARAAKWAAFRKTKPKTRTLTKTLNVRITEWRDSRAAAKKWLQLHGLLK